MNKKKLQTPVYEKIKNRKKLKSKNTGNFRYGVNLSVSFETHKNLLIVKKQNNFKSLAKTTEFLVNKHLDYIN